MCLSSEAQVDASGEAAAGHWVAAYQFVSAVEDVSGGEIQAKSEIPF